MAKEASPKGAKGAKAAPGSKPRTKTVRLGDDLTDQLQAMADARQMSFSAVVRTASEMYLQREEFAVALGDVEARIAASLNNGRKDTARVSEDVQLLIAMFDQLTKFVMITTPEVLDKEGAGALGNRRHSAFIAELHNSFSSRKKKAKITQELENMEGDGNG